MEKPKSYIPTETRFHLLIANVIMNIFLLNFRGNSSRHSTKTLNWNVIREHYKKGIRNRYDMNDKQRENITYKTFITLLLVVNER